MGEEQESEQKIVRETSPLDPFEATLGLRHRDIKHLLEILDNPQAPKPNKIKALHLLQEVLPGRQLEADADKVIEILSPYLMQPPNGLLLNTLVCFNTLINTEILARKMLEHVPRIVEVISPEIEPPVRTEAARLLRLVAEFTGPVPAFLAGSVRRAYVDAVGNKESDPGFLKEAYGLLSRLANKQDVRVPLIESSDVLNILVKSLANPELRDVALNFASNIAMDPRSAGKCALLDADILTALVDFLRSPNADLRRSVLSLIALLAVPKEGKNQIATEGSLPDLIKNIIKNDPDESCRKSAETVKVLVCELPVGNAIMNAE